MYLYDEIDQRMVDERVAQFRDQTRRFLDGKLAEVATLLLAGVDFPAEEDAVREAVEQKKWSLADEQISVVARVIEKEADFVSAIAAELDRRGP